MNKKLKYLLIFVASTVLGLGLLAFISANRPVPSAITEVTVANFQQEVGDSKIPVFIEFYLDDAECEPCAKQKPIIEKLAAEYAGKVKFVRVHARNQGAISQAVGVRSVPTHLLVDPASGKGVAGAGLADEATLRAMIEGFINPQTAPAPSPQPAPDNNQPQDPADKADPAGK